MTPIRVASATLGLIVLIGLTACGGKDSLTAKCLEPKPYQAVVPGKRVEVPDDLDPLESLKEMPIPKALTPPQTEPRKCLESPPSIG